MVTNNDIGYNPSSFESLPEIHEMTTLAFEQMIRKLDDTENKIS